MDLLTQLSDSDKEIDTGSNFEDDDGIVVISHTSSTSSNLTTKTDKSKDHDDDDVVVTPLKKSSTITKTKKKDLDDDEIIMISSDEECESGTIVQPALPRQRQPSQNQVESHQDHYQHYDEIHISSLPASDFTSPLIRQAHHNTITTTTTTTIRPQHSNKLFVTESSSPAPNRSYLSDLSEIDINIRQPLTDIGNDNHKHNSSSIRLGQLKEKFDSLYDESASKKRKPALAAVPVAVQKPRQPNKRKKRAIAEPIPSQQPSRDDLAALFEYHKLYNERALKSVNKTSRSREEIFNEMILCYQNKTIDFISKVISDNSDEAGFVNAIQSISELDLDLNMFRFKRKSQSIYYDKEKVFLPLTETEIIDEPYAIIYEKIDENFIKKLKNGDIDNNIALLKQSHDTRHCIVLILEGETVFLQKMKRLENQNYTAKMRSQLQNEDQATTSGAAPKVRSEKEVIITKEEYDSLILDLQFKHGLHLFPTKKHHDTLQWLKAFTYTVGINRYNNRNVGAQGSPFDASSIGPIKSGSTDQEILSRSLEQLRKFTPNLANKIFSGSSSLTNLGQLYDFLAIQKKQIPELKGKIEQNLYKLLTTKDPDFIIT